MDTPTLLLVNLTPHAIRILGHGLIEPTYPSARVSEETYEVGTVNGIPVVCKSYGEVENLPDPVEGMVYITSALVAARVPQRDDVLAPANLLRDEEGNVCGCGALASVSGFLPHTTRALPPLAP